MLVVNRKRIRPKHRDECFTDEQVSIEHGRKRFKLFLKRGDIVFHPRYNECYIFLFVDNGRAKYSDSNGEFYENLNHEYEITKATLDQEQNFWEELKKNGYQYKNKKIIKIK